MPIACLECVLLTIRVPVGKAMEEMSAILKVNDF